MVTTCEPIIIVEDDADVAAILKARLNAAGYEVQLEQLGADAIRRIYSRQPALVILDVQLPDVDGYAVCEELRYRYDPEEVPIVMFTVLDDPEHEARGRAAGANAYLSKDRDAGQLMQTIEDLLANPLPHERLA